MKRVDAELSSVVRDLRRGGPAEEPEPVDDSPPLALPTEGAGVERLAVLEDESTAGARDILFATGCPEDVVDDVVGQPWEGDFPFRWRAEREWSCVIHGVKYGTGKTHAATLLFLAEVIRRQQVVSYLDPDGTEHVYRFAYPGRWISVRELVARAREDVATGSGFGARLRSLIGIEVLLLDDLAVSRLTPFVAETLDYVLGERYRRRPTIITSNVAEVEELRKIEGRIVSRLCDGRSFGLDSDRWVDRRREGR